MKIDLAKMKQGWRMYSVHAMAIGTALDGAAAIINQNHIFAQHSVTLLAWFGVASQICGLVGRFVPQESIN